MRSSILLQVPSVSNICSGSAATVTVVAPNALAAGTYTVTYNLTGCKYSYRTHRLYGSQRRHFYYSCLCTYQCWVNYCDDHISAVSGSLYSCRGKFRNQGSACDSCFCAILLHLIYRVQLTASIPGSHGTTAECSSSNSYTIPTATVSNDASYTWSTSGTGSLSATTGTLAPTYNIWCRRNR